MCVCSWVSKLWILLLVNKPSFVLWNTICFVVVVHPTNVFAVFGSSCHIIDSTKLATDIKDLIIWSATPRAFFNLKYVGWASALLHQSYRCCICHNNTHLIYMYNDNPIAFGYLGLCFHEKYNYELSSKEVTNKIIHLCFSILIFELRISVARYIKCI